MAFFRSILTAQRLKKYKNKLVDEKQDSINYQETKKRRFKFVYLEIKIKQKIKRVWRRLGYCCCCKKFCFNLKHSNSVENYIFKSIVGFFAGLILTYIFFLFFVFQLSFTFTVATVICSILGCILVNGLAFSSKVRCVVLLTLPHFFSERGRQFLVAYALLLVVTGPAKNTLNNLGILSESLACGQEQLKTVVRQIIEVVKKPFYALKDAIKKVIETVKIIIKKIKEILIQIKRIIMAIIRVIKAAFMFLAKIINICNKELGTPFERCSRVFENAIADCNAKLGSWFSWMCSLTYIVKAVCYLVKIFDFVCMIVDFIKDSIIGVVIRKIKGFIRHIRTMFYVRIKFSHSFHFETTSSKNISEISKEILHEIKERTRTIMGVFRIFTSTASIFFIFMIVKVLIYRYRFLTKDNFDNKFITEDFFKIDMRRAKINRETVLPLNSREQKIYVKIKSTQLTDVEKKKLKKAIMTLASVNMKAAIYMAIDYSLYWILNLISRYGRFQSKVQAPNIPTPHVSGKGFLADLLKSIIKAFQPMGIQLEIDTIPCLPTPIPPDLDRYIQIATLLILCWVLTLLEPYGLRLRTFIMCFYHPLRGKQRAIWLYNNILRKRTSFLKFARRQLRRKVLGNGNIDKVTMKEFLVANFRCLGICLDEHQTACLLCGKVFRKDDSDKPIQCKTPDCPGLYCEECFADLRNLCTICLSPIEYGDISDLSEERDSSDEEKSPIKKKKPKKGNKRKTCKYWFNICSKIPSESDESSPLLPLHSNDTLKKGFFSRLCSKKSKKRIYQEVTLHQQFSQTGTPLSSSIHSKRSIITELNIPEETVNLLSEEKIEKDVEDEEDYILDKEVLNLFEESSDSGQATATSAATSTDYSYSYQYEKDAKNVLHLEMPPKDVEKQAILDYASMDSFRDESDEDFLASEILDIEEAEVSNVPIGKTSSMEITYEDELSSADDFTERVDVGTIISGETIAKARQAQHIEFVGVTDKNVTAEKRKKRRKRKKKTKYDRYSDSDSEQVSLITVPKSTTFTHTKGRLYSEKLCRCQRPICKCNISVCPSEEENTTNSCPYDTSTEVNSLSEQSQVQRGFKTGESDNIEMQEITRTDGDHAKERDKSEEGARKSSKLRTFVKRVIPKVILLLISNNNETSAVTSSEVEIYYANNDK